MKSKIKLVLGDCIEKMREIPENSVDTIITDPPYHLASISKRFSSSTARNTPAMNTKEGAVWARKAKGFMGKEWDDDIAFHKSIWEEALRVIKPGGTMLCFGGSRTYHRIACAIEDAGFILKDCIMWLYASGFPKATDISKQLDKGQRKKELIPTKKGNLPEQAGDIALGGTGMTDISKPISKQAKLWNGWKSHGLKPAYEPILVAMKPNEGSYAQNALKHGVSGLNIDGGRIKTAPDDVFGGGGLNSKGDGFIGKSKTPYEKGMGFRNDNKQGRFPANIILDEEAGKIIDKDVGDNVSRFFKQVDITIEELSELPISEISRIIGRDRKTIRNKLKELGLYKEPKKYVKNNDTERVCEICGELKEIEEFAKWRSGKDYGYRHICKECQNCRWLPKTKEEKEKRKASSLAYAHNVRAKDRKENKITKEDVIELKSVGKCIYCGATNTEFQIDHIVPVAKGGKTEVINLVLACARCNRSKNDRNLEEWYKEQPFYNEEKLRTFYCAKASKSERNMGCEGLEVKESKTMSERKPDFSGDSNNTTGQNPSLSRNNHPTVKPIKLMEYLCILTKTPTGGVVLDPFAGSFTTGIACINTGRDFIGIEKEEEYFKIGKARIEYAVQKRKERLF